LRGSFGNAGGLPIKPSTTSFFKYRPAGGIFRLRTSLSLTDAFGKVISKVQPFEPVLVNRNSPPKSAMILWEMESPTHPGRS
jgi:hypothetical protein